MSGRVENIYNSWEKFSEVVKKKWRYTFFLEKASVADVLSDIVNFLKDEPELTPSLAVGTQIYRSRTFSHLSQKTYTAEELGTPDEKYVRNPNRFNPIGIPMFYGALDRKTSRREVADDKDFLIMGKFHNTQPIKVIDLGTAQTLPRELLKTRKGTLNDETRNELLFLDSFAYSLTLPVCDELMLDYIPMQIFAEYIRRVGRQKLGVRGIKYPSTQNQKGCNVVLFYSAKECVNTANKNDDCLVLDETYIYRCVVPYTRYRLAEE